MTSMKDISALCGVSIATVSKALNDQSDIGEETKARIRQVAKELGYFPNSSARALKTKRTYNLGVLFVDEAQSGLTHDYFSYVLNSFKQVVEERGYDITFISAGKDEENRMSYLERCRYRGFDGVVMTDWFSTNRGQASSALAMHAGNDLIMPGGKSYRKDIMAGVKNGTISEDDIHRCCLNVVKSIMNSQTQRDYIS